jgi:hypothetical protein
VTAAHDGVCPDLLQDRRDAPAVGIQPRFKG